MPPISTVSVAAGDGWRAGPAPGRPGIIMPMTWRFLLAFFCLTAIMGISHELAHHVAGFLICGDWGYKTFNSFMLAEGCRQAHPGSFWLATLAGPVLFNYLPMWIGFHQMRQADPGKRLFGLALVFSTIPIMRIVFSLLGANDEPWLIRLHFGDSSLAFWLMNAAIWALTLPPLVLAWQTIGNRLRPAVYLLFFLGVPVLVFVLVGIVLEDLIIRHKVLADTVWGMPYMVLLAEVLACIGYRKFAPHLRSPAARPVPAN
jgi:hypothetical protein